MFSGIVEEAAQVVAIQSDKGNIHLTMRCSFVDELKIDQTVLIISKRRQLHCKRWPFKKQNAVFYAVKGHVLHCVQPQLKTVTAAGCLVTD